MRTLPSLLCLFRLHCWHSLQRSGGTIWSIIWQARGISRAKLWGPTPTTLSAASAPATERRYESIWYLGYDAISERYVLHLMDTFGGRFSETLGYGTRDGNQIKFVFEYPDGPFHTTYLWNEKENSWEWLMEQKDKSGKWGSFADLKLTPFSSPR